MDQTPKYYTLSRRTIGNLNAATKVLNKLSTTGISSSVTSALATLMAGAKINLILPILAGLIAFLAQTSNDVILYIISVSDIDDSPDQD